MGLNRITRRVTAWIACLAMLFGALAPALSQALPAATGAPWAEICSISGTKLVNVGAAPGEDAHGTKHVAFHAEHCPLCATHAGAFALPATAGFTIPLIAPQATHPVLFFQSPRPLAIWTVAQSRAPPSLS